MDKYEYLAPSMKGKHDLQLQKELNKALEFAGIKNWYSSIERVRGRIKVQCIDINRSVIERVVTTMFPEFKATETNPTINNSYFLLFQQKIQLNQ